MKEKSIGLSEKKGIFPNNPLTGDTTGSVTTQQKTYMGDSSSTKNLSITLISKSQVIAERK
jgi:hypothetical protein